MIFNSVGSAFRAYGPTADKKTRSANLVGVHNFT